MLAVRRVRLPLALGEVVLLAAAAVRGGEQGPAVGGDLQGGLQGGQGGLLAQRGDAFSGVDHNDYTAVHYCHMVNAT